MQFGMRSFKASKPIDEYREFREVYAELTSSLIQHGFDFDARPKFDEDERHSSVCIYGDDFRFEIDYYPVEAHFDSWREQLDAESWATLEADLRVSKDLSSAREYMESNFGTDNLEESDESLKEYVERRFEKLERTFDGLGTN
ncbi:MAG: hypothetical protein H8Z69_01450 [Nanohaloarchaea archaeon]|nr:hypothetical protein [Candidatus Nanohaloarchaea archaeon]